MGVGVGKNRKVSLRETHMRRANMKCATQLSYSEETRLLLYFFRFDTDVRPFFFINCSPISLMYERQLSRLQPKQPSYKTSASSQMDCHTLRFSRRVERVASKYGFFIGYRMVRTLVWSSASSVLLDLLDFTWHVTFSTLIEFKEVLL